MKLLMMGPSILMVSTDVCCCCCGCCFVAAAAVADADAGSDAAAIAGASLTNPTVTLISAGLDY